MAFEVFQFFTDIGFVIQIMALAYIIFWLYLTFRESQVLFGISAIIASYFMLTVALPTVLVVIVFILFVVMGNQMQMLLMFGIEPVLGFLGIHITERGKMEVEQNRMMGIQKKVEQGQMLSQQEEQFLMKQQQHSAAMEQHTQQMQMQRMSRRSGQ